MRLCLRARRSGFAVAALAMLGAVTVLTFPAAYELLGRGGSMIPLMAMMPVLLGCVVGLTAGAVHPAVERLAGERLVRVVRVHAAALTAWGAMVMVASGWVGTWLFSEYIDSTGWWLVTAMVRALMAYSGLSLLSSALLGSFYAWVLPVISIPVVTLLGSDDSGEPLVWNPVNAPPDQPVAWIVTSILLLAGMAAIRAPATGRPLLSRLLRS